MKKIGLYLGGNPKSGGVFQYNIAMLEAVAALPGDQFERVIFYSSVNWEKYVRAYKLEAHCVSRSIMHKVNMVIQAGRIVHEAGVGTATATAIPAQENPVIWFDIPVTDLDASATPPE